MANNMTVTDGVQNWETEGILSGDIDIELSDGTSISITQAVCTETKRIIRTAVNVHSVQDMEISLFGKKANEFTKRTETHKGTTWTTIRAKGE